MILRIKGLTKITVIFMAMTVGAYCNTALHTEFFDHTAHAIEASPSPQPSPLKGEGEKVMGEAIKIPDVVATINGVNIAGEELETRMARLRLTNPKGFDAMSMEEKKMLLTRTLDSMVVRKLMYLEAVKRNIDVTAEEIEMKLEETKRQFPSEDAFMKALQEDKLTIQAWKGEAKKNLMAMKLEEMTVDGIKIPDNEIEAYYKRNRKELNQDAVKISHILVNTEEEAKKVIQEFEEGKDFSGLAKKYSLDRDTKDKGGYLGWYIRGELSKEVEDAAYSLSPGHISAPIKGHFGYHIIRLDDKKAGEKQTLEDHRERIISILREDKWKGIRFSWLGMLFNDTKVWKWAPGNEEGGNIR